LFVDYKVHQYYGHNHHFIRSNVGKIMPSAPPPSHHHEFIGGMVTIPSHGWFTLWLFNIAMKNGPFTDDFPS
jgi:hypothetical protein